MSSPGGNTHGRRSVLSVPASDERKIAKALAAEVDEIVLDLEDAVAPGDKERARDLLAAFPWPDHPTRAALAVRVNAPRSAWCHRDLACAVSAVPAASVVLPKVGSRGDLDFVERLLDGLEAEASRAERVAVQALVETAAGLVALPEIVARPDRLTTLVIGYADLAADLGRGRGLGSETWLPAQHAVLSCARAAGLEAVDGPYLGVADDQDFRSASRHAAGLGFDAKWVIHPQQLATVNAAFTPSADEVQHARQVVDVLDAGHEQGVGAVRLEGELVDEAMALAARRVLAKAAR